MGMDTTPQSLMWERRQSELWDRIFQVTQDIVVLAESFDDRLGGAVIKEEMVRAAMNVGKYLVRATAADTNDGFVQQATESKMSAIETDYWLRLGYIIQQREDVQRDLSNIITQYSGIITQIQKLADHVEGHKDAQRHGRRPKVSS